MMFDPSLWNLIEHPCLIVLCLQGHTHTFCRASHRPFLRHGDPCIFGNLYMVHLSSTWSRGSNLVWITAKLGFIIIAFWKTNFKQELLFSTLMLLMTRHWVDEVALIHFSSLLACERLIDEHIVDDVNKREYKTIKTIMLEFSDESTPVVKNLRPDVIPKIMI